jgi:hypothetical protein
MPSCRQGLVVYKLPLAVESRRKCLAWTSPYGGALQWRAVSLAKLTLVTLPGRARVLRQQISCTIAYYAMHGNYDHVSI